MSNTHVTSPDQYQVEETPWGRLNWHVSAALGNSETMTVGRCFIKPGDQNGRHLHPNCDEILSVLKGHIEHSWNDEKFEMREGDVVSIPSGVVHNARNIGTDEAELAISFSSAYRETLDEE